MLSVDTNLLFYSIDESSPFHSQALAFLKSVREASKVAISELVLVELYRLLRNPTLNPVPLSPAAATRVVETYRHHPSWRLVGFPIESRPLHDQLWSWAAQPGFAYRRIYDARLALSLLAFGVVEFATVNRKDFADFGFQRVFNPLEPATKS